MAAEKKITMKVSDVEIFNKVAATLSFTRAGQLVGLTRSAVSKRISRLESDAGVPLLNRTARSITLTPAGERFYDQTIKLEETMKMASEAVKDAKKTPYGKLAFTMPTSLGASLTPLLMREFQRNWPDINLSINLDEQYLDIVAEGYDVAIRVAKKLGDSGLMSKRLMTSPEVLVASPGYLRKFGRPTRAEELRITRCLALVKREMAWRLIGPDGPVTIRLEHVTTFNNDLAMILAAVLDGGILLTPRVLVESEMQLGRLEIILDKYKTKHDFGVFAVYPNRHPAANVRVFVEFLEKWLPRMGELDRWDPLQLANNQAYRQ